MIEPPDTDRGNILVVDDNEMNRDMLARRLERRGYTATIAVDGHQALRLLRERVFDLVLLDIEMPEMDGIAVLKILRETHLMSALPVIMVTARQDSHDIVNALGEGANDYVTKPIDFAVVLARVRTQLGLKRATDEVRSMAIQLETRNELLRKIFGRYVDTGVVDKLLASPEALRFGGELRTITALFADLRGFTLVIESMRPEQVVSLLNNCLSALIEVVAKYNGIVDEIVGDGIFAFFGAPGENNGHASRAVACAIEMQLAMETVNSANRTAGLPELRLGIGLHTGEAVVGNIGSERRSKYSIVGRHVNLASRIEGCSVGGQVLVSEATLGEVGAIARIDGRMSVWPKGMEAPVSIYDIGGIAGTYNIFLPCEDSALHQLPQEVPIRYKLMDEKRTNDQSFEGRLVRLSRNGGEVRLVTDRRRLAALSDIRIEITACNGRGGHLYAKVLGCTDESGDVYCMRFTSTSSESSAVLADMLNACGALDPEPA